MTTLRDTVEFVGLVVDGVGVAVIVFGLIVATARFVVIARKVADPYRSLRQDLGRGILLGLEFLIAADIIRTVAVTHPRRSCCSGPHRSDPDFSQHGPPGGNRRPLALAAEGVVRGTRPEQKNVRPPKKPSARGLQGQRS